MMTVTAYSALWFLPFAVPICFFVAYSDISQMKIPNISVVALFVVFAVVGLIALPFDEYLWRYAHLVCVLVLGFALNMVGALGAGDAKFAAAAAPLIALGDLKLVFMILAASLLAAWVSHRLVRAIPLLRNLAPEWKSWHVGNDFPMGLALGATLVIYLGLGVAFGSV
ncbi:prepilin peptidase [Algirhabdus cladophorae]|uniref:prepilin peptidase n=1 Tax=Algirhabdus cladophorae TaxID=3377108 RepID=UPI003B8471F1